MGLTSNVISELQQLIPPERVVTDPSELYVYDCDGFTIARNVPRAVVFAQSTDEVAAVVRLLAERDVQIVPRGSGTGLTGGCVAYENGVIVSTTSGMRLAGTAPIASPYEPAFSCHCPPSTTWKCGTV